MPKGSKIDADTLKIFLLVSVMFKHLFTKLSKQNHRKLCPTTSREPFLRESRC